MVPALPTLQTQRTVHGLRGDCRGHVRSSLQDLGVAATVADFARPGSRLRSAGASEMAACSPARPQISQTQRGTHVECDETLQAS